MSIAEAKQAGTLPKGPIWLATIPHSSTAAVPVIASAREVRHLGGARIWITRSNQGGICLLIFAPQLAAHPARTHTIYSACGHLDRGPSFLASSDRNSFAAGLVPAGVSRVAVHFADGSSSELAVANNSYVISSPKAIEAIAVVGNGAQQGMAIPTGGS